MPTRWGEGGNVSDATVPTAPGWWLLDGKPVAVHVDGVPHYSVHGSTDGPYRRVHAVHEARWGGQLVPRADLDAARAEERAKLETAIERLGRAGTAWHESQADLAEARARIAELEAKVAEAREALQLNIAEMVTLAARARNRARRAALREAADDMDAAADKCGNTRLGYGLRKHAAAFREKAEAT
jgi:hypothetical protein